MSPYLPPQPVAHASLRSTHRIITRTLIALLVAAVLGSITWEVLRATTPPALALTSPSDNLLTENHSLELVGKAAPEATVTVNNEPVSISADGAFTQKLDLRTGLNIITISASKKFSKARVIYRRVVVTDATVSAGTDASMDAGSAPQVP